MLHPSAQNSNVYVLYQSSAPPVEQPQEQVILVDELQDPSHGYPSNGNYCYYCGPVPKEFSVRSSLYRHFRVVHPDIAEQEIERLSHRPKNSIGTQLSCHVCGKNYTLKNLLIFNGYIWMGDIIMYQSVGDTIYRFVTQLLAIVMQLMADNL